MGLFSSFFNPEDAYEKAQDELNKFYGQSQNYYNQGNSYINPYNQNGQNAHVQLSQAMNELLDPQALQDKWIKGYKESEAARNAMNISRENALTSASGQGLVGSSAAARAAQEGASQIALADRQNYLNDLMKKYLAGAGFAQNIYGTGANAAGQQSQNAMTMGQNAMTMGQNSAQVAQERESAPGKLFGDLIGAGIGLFGGPIGSFVSNKLGWTPTGTFNAGTPRRGVM